MYEKTSEKGKECSTAVLPWTAASCPIFGVRDRVHGGAAVNNFA